MVNFKPLLPAAFMLTGCPNIDISVTPPPPAHAHSTSSKADIQKAIAGTMRTLGQASFRQIPCSELSVGNEMRAQEERRNANIVGRSSPAPSSTETAFMRYQSRQRDNRVAGCMEKSYTEFGSGRPAETELIFSYSPSDASTGWVMAVDHIDETRDRLNGSLSSLNWVVTDPDNLSKVTLGNLCKDTDVVATYPSVRCSDATFELDELIKKMR